MTLLRFKSTTHYPELYRDFNKLVSEYLAIKEDTKAMIDGSFGGGGHSIQLINQHKKLKVLGTDMDYHVLAQCRQQYEKLIEQRRLALCHTNYANIPSLNLKKEFDRKITTKEWITGFGFQFIPARKIMIVNSAKCRKMKTQLLIFASIQLRTASWRLELTCSTTRASTS